MNRSFWAPKLWMLNGEQSEKDSIYDTIRKIEKATNCGIHVGDCLITWGRNLGFLDDSALTKKLNALTSSGDSDAQILLSTIWRRHLLTWAAEQCIAIPGDFVEGGCYRGDTVDLIIDYTQFEKFNKDYYLYDVFDNHDTSEKLPSHSDHLYDFVRERFAERNFVKIVRGFIPDSFSQAVPDVVSFLHVDLNNPAAEVAVLDKLWDRISVGGICIFDDYGWTNYSDQKAAIDKFLNARSHKVVELPTGQGMAIKKKI